ncbi:MAG: CoB--CoM heterodisulfide reductase iron-sulfur subunit B family protein [Bacillota bacterium]|nr:CoB--CoM heterodisulfide reductase iron-sulfur subunit B family protein [Bacillota bacterium]
MRVYSYYPGCSLEGTAKEYDYSLRALAPLLGMQLVEIHDWSCCGSSAAHATSHRLALALAARNLNLAADMPGGARDILVPCAMCYNRLKVTSAELAADSGLRSAVESDLGDKWRGAAITAKALPEVLLGDIGVDAVAQAVVQPLEGLRVASYYGCLLVRPPEYTGFDDPESPKSMDELVRATGATPVDWPHKVECCGGGLSITNRELVAGLVADILGAARDAGADVIVTACPMCQANLDTRQGLAGKTRGTDFGLPVLYITQLLGLACGLSAASLSFQSHLVSVAPLLEKVRQLGRARQAAGGEGC